MRKRRGSEARLGVAEVDTYFLLPSLTGRNQPRLVAPEYESYLPHSLLLSVLYDSLWLEYLHCCCLALLVFWSR